MLSALLLIVGCASMEIGSSKAKTVATGSAGGANAQGESSSLEKCDKTFGTAEVIEDRDADWYWVLHQYKLKSTVPVLKLLAQQSNCFVIVDRGSKAMKSMKRERSLAESGELRKNSNFGKGQMVSADFALNPSLTFSDKNAGSIGGSIGGLIGGTGGHLIGGVASSASFKEASTMLTLVDNRSSVQLAAAEGSARNTDFGAWGRLIGSTAGGSLGGYASTAEGKVIAAALTDAFNNLIRALRNYKMQNVKGGLGTGRSGSLKVQPD